MKKIIVLLMVLAIVLASVGIVSAAKSQSEAKDQKRSLSQDKFWEDEGQSLSSTRSQLKSQYKDSSSEE